MPVGVAAVRCCRAVPGCGDGCPVVVTVQFQCQGRLATLQHGGTRTRSGQGTCRHLPPCVYAQQTGHGVTKCVQPQVTQE